jgi:RNA polymerase sigma-70 factor, ECF subfamily
MSEGLAVQEVAAMVHDGALPDEAIVARVRAGETVLFEILMRRNNERVYRAVRAILGDDHESEDVMQQAYVSAFTHLEQFAGTARFSTWLTKIAIHEAFARLRRKRRHVDLSDDNGGDGMNKLPALQADPEEKASRRELSGLLEAAVDTLPELYRLVFVLREVQELSTAEAAACMDVSEEVVKTRLHRARALLRDALYTRVGGAAGAFEFQATRCNRVVAGVMSRLPR